MVYKVLIMLHGCFDTELGARWNLMTEMCLTFVSWVRSDQAADRIWVSSSIWQNPYSVQVSANKGSCCLLHLHRQCKTDIKLTHNERPTQHHVRTQHPVRTYTNTMLKTHTDRQKHTLKHRNTKRQPDALTFLFNLNDKSHRSHRK